MSRRFAAAAAAAALAFAAVPAWASTNVRSQTEPPILARMRQAAADVNAGRCDKALPSLREAFDRPDYLALSRQTQASGYEMAAMCELAAERLEPAEALLGRAATAGTLSDHGLRAYYWLSVWRRDAERAVDLLEQLALRGPAAAADLRDAAFFELDAALMKSKPLRMRQFAAWERLDFKPSEPYATADGQWLIYARWLHEAGQTEAAGRIAERITHPEALLLLRLDGRFARQVEAAPSRFDLRRAVERKLEQERPLAAARPDRLEGTFEVATGLLQLGRSEDALAVLDTALAGKPASAFADSSDWFNWTLDLRARVLRSLGRYDEAVEALREGARAEEHGAPNASQVINLAELLVALGRAEEGLHALAPVKDDAKRASAYGDMWAASIEACAYVQLGREAEWKATLSWLNEHATANSAALTRALLCADDLDGAAASYVWRLDDPDRRADALTALSEFDPPAAVTPHEQVLREQLAKVRARTDVRAAIARAGRTERVPLSPIYWGAV